MNLSTENCYDKSKNLLSTTNLNRQNGFSLINYSRIRISRLPTDELIISQLPADYFTC